jgi:hypothetical protein
MNLKAKQTEAKQENKVMHIEAAGSAAYTPHAMIVNITEQRHLAQRTYGTFQIAERTPGTEFAVTRITPRNGVIDYGDKRTVPLAISAREIAEDLCREINSDAGEQSFLGVFVCAGEAPTAEELQSARGQLEDFYRGLVATADREWERSHSFLFINDLQRKAANSLGMEKEWCYQMREMQECPGCGERVKPNVAVCRACGAILDREKALALGLARPAEEPGAVKQPTRR